MATARKTTRSRKPAPRKNNSKPAWLLLVFGIVIGLGVAGLAWLLLPTPPTATEKSAPAAAKAATKPAKPTKTAPKATSSDSPDYTFYTVLPQSEVRVPDDAKPAAKPAAASNERFVLQIGSFRQAADADRRRAELILTGFDAFVEEASLNAGETWHRVFVGPFNHQDAAQQARNSLSGKGIESLLLKRDGT